ncbi:hypothetical protein PR048_005704 [Dryococelus australis]|uniref:Zinc finger BED domain-containing protein 1 n=1 Tax=Dryococelus australis TaxID=614101 RepID=A0ABQ9I9W4_9NEOP|nr:hypothetical protein PR048_005704 [Dryococelus australis]
MLQSLIEQKNAVASCIADLKMPHSLNSFNWTTINNLFSVLKLFKEVTTIVSDYSASASQIIPLVNSLRKAVQLDISVGMTSVKKDILRELKKQFPSKAPGESSSTSLLPIEMNDTYALVTCLDPRFKDKAFSAPERANNTNDILRNHVMSVMPKYEKRLGSTSPVLNKSAPS